MKYQLNASCSKCGFEQTLSFGSDETDAEQVNFVPALDAAKGILLSVDLSAELPPNSDLMFYNEQKMFACALDETAICNKGVCLSLRTNLCPDCVDFYMDFKLPESKA